MNKEQLEALAELCSKICILEQENQLLHNKIDKAIEIIESYNLGKYDYTIPPIGISDLLEILKDSDVNGRE